MEGTKVRGNSWAVSQPQVQTMPVPEQQSSSLRLRDEEIKKAACANEALEPARELMPQSRAAGGCEEQHLCLFSWSLKK